MSSKKRIDFSANGCSMADMQQFSYEHLLSDLKQRVSVTTQKAVAKSLKVTPQFLNDVLKGKREISKKLARSMGYNKRIVFESSNGRSK